MIQADELQVTLNQLPQVTRTYQNPILDSTRWEHYVPQQDDIIVSTSYKSGTTWMQNIVLQLIYLGREIPKLADVSPWPDFRLEPVEALIQRLKAQENRRLLKTHIPLDGLTYYPQVKYIVVGRDARDVFMSWWNHYSNFTEAAYDKLNNTPGRVGPRMPRCPQNIRTYWRTWISKGWFEWENEGYPHSGNMYHTQTWWNFRHLPNILFVHFNDLLANLKEEIVRIARFLAIPVSDASVSSIAHAVSLQEVKKNADQIIDVGFAQAVWKNGVDTFFYKGTNGRWKDILTSADLALYETAVVRNLTSDCAQWLEKGRIALRE